MAITTRWRSRLRGQSQSEAVGRFELFGCLTAGSYERERVEFRLGSGDRASSASDSPVSAVPSPFIRSTLLAPRRSICTAETTPARRENPAASLVPFTDQVNLPRPKNERKSAAQLMIPLASGDLVSSASDSPVSAVPSPFIRSTLLAPRRSVCTAETTPARRENPAASLV